ncbi:S8 family serine peptidase [Fulvivirga lutea]|uniref:S8 family serine peptidase n=1 Tax=Fulvivirga lutea TaxID=2810512 RepID=A0A974WHC6_9BACT|nr:S8 family serine peptidase [Fulvivirga lutea]QSE97252.1 S8 family serine peptidase [Fulvivirga lutea]
MKRLISIFFLLILSAPVLIGQKRTYELPKGVNDSQYDANTIIVKLKSGEHKAKSLANTELFSKPPQAALLHTAQKNNHPLSSIYKVQVEEGKSVLEEINRLLSYDEVEYAEPYFNHRPLLLPNDPGANPTTGAQYYLNNIRAYDAWSIEQGDSTIVIGILDSGVEPNHTDMVNQIAYNFNDPINGIDDDGDGLVDNFAGWDIADNDNNPVADVDVHGTEVGAVSSARTNNGIGIAGTGYKSKFLPIKIFTSPANNFKFGYEAIALAADLGCKVINLSWGSAGSFSQFGQDVINYAVLEKDVVIIAAAGNTNEELDFYPASFDNVISVSASDINDEKTFFATFSHKVDMVAPGIEIYTATNGNTYGGGRSGTSFSAPMVAGAAALVRARFPDLSAQQVMERLRATADDIYTIGTNSTYEGMLGKGRLNMLRALTDVTPSIRIDSSNYTNGLGNFAYRGDTLELHFQFKNYLDAFQSGEITISSNSPHVTFLTNTFNVASLSTLQSTDNFDEPFQVKLSNNTPPDTELVFRLDYTDGVYEDFEYISIVTSSPHTIIQGNNLAMTVTSDGDLGYDADFLNDGIGIQFEGELVADNTGLILSFSQTEVIDNAPTNFSSAIKDSDFEVIEHIKRNQNGYAPIEAKSVFNNGDTIRIEQTSLSNDQDDFIIQDYRIVNTGSQSFNDFTLNLFSDWNIGDQDFNRASWSGAHKLGYIHNGTTYVGIALISNQDSVYSAVNNRNFNGNSADIPATLNDSVKYAHTSAGILQTEAGEVNTGNDVSHFIGAQIDLLEVNQAEKVTFCFVAGHSLAELIDLVSKAKTFYSDHLANPPIVAIAETCVGEPAIINPSDGTLYNFYSDVELANLLESGESFTTGPITSPTKFYAINKDNAFDSDVYTVIAKPKLVEADFSANPSPLLLDETGNSIVRFTDLSVDGASWHWQFDNGFTSNVKNPQMNFTSTGMYNISLNVTNDIGCSETVIKSIEVANRSNLPNIADVSICKNEEVTFTATNATDLEFYSDEQLSNLISSGTSFTNQYEKDTSLYVISTDSVYQSNPKHVRIHIDDVTADFTFHPDTLDISSTNLLSLKSTSIDQVLDIWYINNELLSTQAELTYPYESTIPFELMLVAESATSCTDTLRVTITPEVSSIPVFKNIDICADSSAIINPEGHFLHFYSDEALTQLQHKGSEILLATIEKDTIIYITNNASLIESAPLAVAINVSDIEARFTTNPEALNLAEASEVNFTDQSIDAIEWVWILESDTISTDPNFSFNFSDIGQYTVELWVRDELGCINNTSILYQVESITSLANEAEEFNIYPNPTSDFLSIQGEGISSIRLFNSEGRQVTDTIQSTNTINLKHLKPGIYLLVIETHSKIYHRKIIKN